MPTPSERARTGTISDAIRAIAPTGGFSAFLGAGASVAAGIPTAGGIIRDLARTSLGAPPENDPESWVRSQPYFDADEPYASVLDASLPSQADRVAYFEHLIAGRGPTRGHRALASLVNVGACRVIVTTNFDRLAEYAVLSECHHAPCVLATDSRTEPTPTRRAQIFKLHGDYLYQNIRNLGHELWMMLESTRRKMAYVAELGPLIVAGYSGSDASVMEAMETEVGRKGFAAGVFWLTLRGVPLNPRTEAVVAASGGAIIEIDSIDAFFAELKSRVPGEETPRFSALGRNPHLQCVPGTDLRAFVEARLPPEDAVEFLTLLARRPELRHLCETAAGLDFVLASFEEEGVLPSAVGHLVDRYIDTLAGAFTEGSAPDVPAAERRVLQLLALGLAESTAGSIVVGNPLLSAFRTALEKGADLAAAGSIAASLSDDNAYRALQMYVGMIDSATPVIGTAARAAYGRPGLHGRNRPWPDAFHRVVRLAGMGRHVHHSLVEHLATLMTLEFDAELWPPYDAIVSLASLGDAACDYLTDCLLDSLQETFAREDAALALGQIGSRRVVARLLQRGAAAADPRDRVHVVYALGQTRNPRAAEAIALLAPGVAVEDQGVVDHAMNLVAPGVTPPKAGATSRGSPLRPALDADEVLRQWCPDLAVTPSVARLFMEYYLQAGKAAINTVEAIGYPADLLVVGGASITARRNEQFWEAEVLCAEALRRYPMISHIYHDLGLVYSAQGRSHTARRYYAVGMSLDPAHATFYNDYAVTMMNLGDLDAARFLLVRALSIDWNDHRPWFNLASVAMGAGGADRSNTVVRLSDGGRITMFHAGATEDANVRDAMICLRRVVELKPDHATACKTLARLSELTGSQPDHPPTEEELFAALHLGEGELGEAIDGSGWPETAILAFQRSSELRYAGDLIGALDALDLARAALPENADILRTRGMLLRAMGRGSAAAAEFETALHIEPWDRHTLMNLSECCRSNGDPDGAVRVAQRAIRADPTAPGAWVSLARAFLAGGKNGDARDALLKAIELSPPFSWTLLHAFDILDELDLTDWLVW
ncbi:MAG TPA: tetratricopeptide repeat protein [Longimicrobium sp.]